MGRWSTGAEDSEELVTSHGISLEVVSQTQDNCRLESDVAKNTAIQQTLSSNGNCPNLTHLLSTVRHPLVHEVTDLESHLLDQVVVEHGRARCGEVGRLQH